VDGSLSASRAAYIGGGDATSNVLAGQIYNIPIRGTHAHAWVMAFEDEMTAFERYAEAMPNNCTFLVDTFDTLQGVKNAIEMGKKLRAKGFDLQGIRLDSGNLLTLSIEARKLLDAAGFERTNIVASNDLDEYEIQKLKAAGAKINVWGVGTRLVTAYDQPALGGVYKLAALKGENGEWDYKIKLSEDPIKVSTPGILNVRRVATEGGGEDVIFDETDCGALPEGKNLLQPMFKKGQFIAQNFDIQAIKNFATANIKKFYAQENQHFAVRLDEKLRLKKELLAKANRH
jgi:nicotinate phosphoribosyltransferase